MLKIGQEFLLLIKVMSLCVHVTCINRAFLRLLCTKASIRVCVCVRAYVLTRPRGMILEKSGSLLAPCF